MDRHAGRDQGGLPGRNRDGVVDAGAQVDAGGPVRGIVRQRELAAEARIQDPPGECKDWYFCKKVIR